MKKIFLISAMISLVGMQPVENIKDTPESRCIGIEDRNDIEPSIYVHCKSCRIGVFFGEVGQEKCSHCGVKKNYKKK